MPSTRRTLLLPLRSSTTSSTVSTPTTLGITQVPEAPIFSTPPAPHHPPSSPGHPPLLPAPNSLFPASPSLLLLGPPHTTFIPPSTPPCLLTLALPLLTRTPSSPFPLIPTPTSSGPHPCPLPRVPSKPSVVLPSLILSNLEKKPLLIRLAQTKLDSLLPPLTQDSWAQYQLTNSPINHILLEDIPIKNIPLPIVEAPATTIAFPALPSPVALPFPVLYPTINVGPFEYLFAAPPCLPTDHHSHQYIVHYEQDHHIWFSLEELINSRFLNTIPWATDLHHATAPFFVTPFCADAYHSIHIHSDSALPPVHICAKVGKLLRLQWALIVRLVLRVN